MSNSSEIVIREVVSLDDPDYFCNKSWTLSFNFNTQSWISFHSYIPNWYIAENNFFYSGLNGGCDLEIIAAEFTGLCPSTTTTSTTPIPPEPLCQLEGTAVRESICEPLDGTAERVEDCSLSGFAVEISTTTSTTTSSLMAINVTNLTPDASINQIIVGVDFETYTIAPGGMYDYSGPLQSGVQGVGVAVIDANPAFTYQLSVTGSLFGGGIVSNTATQTGMISFTFLANIDLTNVISVQISLTRL